jgi:chitinase
MRLWGLNLILLCASALTFADNSSVVSAYYENWSQYRPTSGGRSVFLPQNIDPTVITDLNFAFAIFGYQDSSVNPQNPHLTGDYTVQPVEWNDQSTLYPQIQNLKKINPKLRTILSIGGWGFNDPQDPNGIGTNTYRLFSQMASTQQGRAQFIQSAVSYAKNYGFDGIDLDWEYPGDLTRGGSESDFSNFILLLSELQSACKSQNPQLLLTFAAPAIVPSGVPQSYRDNPQSFYQWLAQCSVYVDRINLMAYDYHGPFDNPKLTGVNAPLLQDTDPYSVNCIKSTLANYLQNGFPASKIVLGLATYGHSYGGVQNLTSTDFGPGHAFSTSGQAGPSTSSPGMLAYYEIADYIASGQLTFGTDSTTETAIAYNPASQQWVSFDTPQTIELKAQYAKSLGLAGVMFWAIDNDEYAWGDKFPNIKSAYKVFYPTIKKHKK